VVLLDTNGTNGTCCTAGFGGATCNSDTAANSDTSGISGTAGTLDTTGTFDTVRTKGNFTSKNFTNQYESSIFNSSNFY